MNERQWKEELKKYLYLLPAKEERDIISYYNELFADYYEQGYSEEQIVAELGDPKEVAKTMVSDYLDDADAIEKKENSDDHRTSEEKAHDVGKKFNNKISSAGRHVSAFFDGLTADKRKKKSSLNSDEKSEYEREIRRHREEERLRKEELALKEKQAKLREEELRNEKIRLEKERQATLNLERELRREKEQKEKEMERAKYYEIDEDDYDDKVVIAPSPKVLKRKTYTQAQRHSFLTNFIYVVFMLLFIAIGVAFIGTSVGALVMTILSTIRYVTHLVSSGSQFLVDIGYIICIYAAELIVFGIGLGIFVGCINKIHKRFFVKKYVMLKKHVA